MRSPDDWNRLEELFQSAAALPAAERAAFLDTACAGNPGLRLKLDSLLAADTGYEKGVAQTIRDEARSLLETGEITGSWVGPYRVLREIGRGGMGSVYLAVRDDDQYSMEVAIKLIRRGMDTEDVLSRFRHERQILANLEHPYIARLLDGGTTRDGRPFLVMEYVTGQTLDAWRGENSSGERGVDIRRRCELFLKICEAVSFAHRNLVVHRDLKPANIFVTPDGSPKLLDFGVAKLLDAEDARTQTATLMAGRALTLGYASPEQIRGLPTTTATDIYSLGLILYELLSGIRAQQVAGRSLTEIEHTIRDQDPPRMGDAVPHLRSRLQGDLEAIVAMAMRKEQDRRYQSAEQMANDIRGYLNGWPVKARQGSFSYRAGKYVHRNRVPIAVGAVLTVALVGGATVATVQAIDARRERKSAVASRNLAETEASEARRQRASADEERHVAELQSQIAESQRQLAERRFDQVRRLSGKFLFDFHDAIAQLPGSTPARKMVVETGLRYYDQLVRDAGKNGPLLEEIARGYDRLGDVQGNPYYGNLGDIPGAEASYRKALSIRSSISDLSPAFQHDRIMGNVRLAQIRIARNDFAAAEHYLREALLFQPEGTSGPSASKPSATPFEVRDALASVWSNLGDTKIRAGLVSEAIAPYQHLLDLSTSLAHETKDVVAAQRRLSLANTKLGEAYARAQLAPQAFSYLKVALEIDKRLATADPNNTSLTRKLFVTYALLELLLRDGPGHSLATPEEAVGYLQGAVEVSDKLSAADPENRQYSRDIVTASDGLGEWLRAQKRTGEAIAAYRKGVAAAKRLNSAGNEGILLQAWQRLALGLRDGGQYEEALDSLSKAEQYANEAEARNPGLPLNIVNRSQILRTRAEVYMGLKRWNDARENLQSTISIYSDQARRDPGNQVFLNEQPGLYAELADCLAASGQQSAAIAALENAIARFHDIEARRLLIPEEEEARRGHLMKLSALQSAR